MALWRIGGACAILVCCAAANAQDCNNNGIDDASEISPLTESIDPAGCKLQAPTGALRFNNATNMPTDMFTLEMWVFAVDPDRDEGVFSYATTEHDNALLLFDLSDLKIFVGDDSVETGINLVDGQWHHLSVVVGNRLIIVYVDGVGVVLEFFTPALPLTNGGQIMLGQEQDCIGCTDPDQAASIIYDDVRLWNVMRFGPDINADMHQRLTGLEPGLVSYWPLDELDVDFFVDFAGGNSLQIEGDAAVFPLTGDCNSNGLLDCCEDFNGNGIADECESFNDCNANGIPDECEDCDGNGVADECDLFDIKAIIDGNAAALSLPDYDDRLIIPDTTDFEFMDFTLEFWVRAPQPSQDGAMFSYATEDDDNSILIFDASNLELVVRGLSWTTGFNVADGQWHHIALVFDSGAFLGNNPTMTLYIDGFEVAVNGFPPAALPVPSGGTIVIGDEQKKVGGGFDPAQAFVGDIDDIRIWNTIRTKSEIQQNMSQLLTGDEEGLRSYWNMEVVGGNDIPDVAGSNDGTLSDSAIDDWRLDCDGNGLLDSCDRGPVIRNEHAIALPSTKSHILIDSIEPLASELTIEFWFRTTHADSATILAIGPDSDPEQILIELDGPLIVRATVNGIVRALNIRDSMPDHIGLHDGKWHFVGISLSQDTVAGGSYMNFVLDHASSGNLAEAPALFPDGANLIFGGSPDGDSTRSFRGDLDELRIWSVQRTSTQMRQQQRTRFEPREAGLAHLFRFDEGSGNIATDSNTTTPIDGTIVGGTAAWIDIDSNGDDILDDCLLPPVLCPEDFNDNQVVDAQDLLTMLVQWGTCTDCPADLNDDGAVDTADLLQLLSAWGPCL